MRHQPVARRTRRQASLAVAALLALVGPPADADVDLGVASLSGWLEAGGRSVSGDDDAAKFDEYRDPHEGLFGAGNLLFQDTAGRHFLRFGAYDIGEDDAEYFFEGGRFGHWGLSGSLNLIPHNYSERARSPYRGVGSGRLTLPFPRQAGQPGLETAVSGSAIDANLDFRTTEGEIGAFFKPNSALEFETGYRIIDRDGRRPEQLFYGFSNYVNFPQPIDERVHEGTADVRYAGDSWNVGLNYTANFFDNDFDSVKVENPLNTRSELGATAMAPDNSSHLVSLTGATLLPTPFVSRIAATAAYGLRFQDDDFVPMTVNPALQSPDLPENSLDGEVGTFLGNIALTARPTAKVGVKARYRIYDYDNDTDSITFTQVSTDDANIANRTVRTVAGSYTQQNASLETSYRLTSRTQAAIGFEWERWNRGSEREVRRLDEYNPEVRLDHRLAKWGRLRASYGFRERNGDGYDFEDDANFELRKFSQADNRRHSFKLLSQLFPREDTDVTLSGSFNITDYHDSDFGLLDDDRFDVGIDASHRPHERVEITAHYSYDWIELRQRSSANAGTENWTGKHEDRAHTGGAEIALDLIPNRLTASTGYFIQRGKGKTHAHGFPPDAVNYPEFENTLQAVTSSLRFQYSEALAFVARHRWEDYEQDDFQFDGLGYTSASSSVGGVPVSGTTDVYLRNGLRDYEAHLFSLSAIYEF